MNTNTAAANKYITQQVSIKDIRDNGRVFKQAYATELLSFNSSTNRPETEFRAYKALDHESSQYSYYNVFVDMYENKIYLIKNDHTSYYATVRNGVIVEITQEEAFAALPPTIALVMTPDPEISTDRIQKLIEFCSRFRPQNEKEKSFMATYRTIYENESLVDGELFVIANSNAVITSHTMKNEDGNDIKVKLYAFNYHDNTVFLGRDDVNELWLCKLDEETVESLDSL